jgi:hypothetical protein
MRPLYHKNYDNVIYHFWQYINKDYTKDKKLCIIKNFNNGIYISKIVSREKLNYIIQE